METLALPPAKVKDIAGRIGALANKILDSKRGINVRQIATTSHLFGVSLAIFHPRAGKKAKPSQKQI